MENLRTIRESRGLGQKAVASELGVTQPTVSDWESGRKTPTLDNLKALAKLYGVSLDYLVGSTNDPGNKKSPDTESELNVDTLEYALYGEAKDLDDDEKKQLLELAKLMRRKRQESEK